MSDFKAKMHQIQFRLGQSPRPRWGSLQRSPKLRSWIIRGPTSKGRGYRKGEEGEREGKGGGQGERRIREGRKGGEGTPVCIFKFSLE